MANSPTVSSVDKRVTVLDADVKSTRQELHQVREEVTGLRQEVGLISGQVASMATGQEGLAQKLDHLIQHEMTSDGSAAAQFDEKIRTVGEKLEAKFENLESKTNDRFAEKSKTPWPLLSILLTLAVLVGALVGEKFSSVIAMSEKEDAHIAGTLKRIETVDRNSITYQFGQLHEKITTLETKLDGSIANRVDKDAKHEEGISNVGKRVDDLKDQVNHYFDNGAGQRIREIVAPMLRDIEWLKSREPVPHPTP